MVLVKHAQATLFYLPMVELAHQELAAVTTQLMSITFVFHAQLTKELKEMETLNTVDLIDVISEASSIWMENVKPAQHIPKNLETEEIVLLQIVLEPMKSYKLTVFAEHAHRVNNQTLKRETVLKDQKYKRLTHQQAEESRFSL